MSWVAAMRQIAPAPKAQAELLLVEPELLLEDERAARDVAEEARHRQAGDEHQSDEGPVVQQTPVGAQRRADPRGRRCSGGSDSRSATRSPRARTQPVDGERHEDAPPGREAQQLPPSVGANTGATPMTSISRENIVAAARPV